MQTARAASLKGRHHEQFALLPSAITCSSGVKYRVLSADHSYVKAFMAVAFLFILTCLSFMGMLAFDDLGWRGTAHDFLNAGWWLFTAGMLIGLTVLIGGTRTSPSES